MMQQFWTARSRTRHILALGRLLEGSQPVPSATGIAGCESNFSSQLVSLYNAWNKPLAEFAAPYATKAGKGKQPKDKESSASSAETLDLKEVEGWMHQPLEHFKTSLSNIRTGRASPGMLDVIKVAAYGESTASHSIKSLASVSVRGPQMLAVGVFDPLVRSLSSAESLRKSTQVYWNANRLITYYADQRWIWLSYLQTTTMTLQSVERAIRSSPLGLNPSFEGDEILVPVPRPSKEALEAVAKMLKAEGESAKVAVRHARKRALDVIKGLNSEDGKKKTEKQVQMLTDAFIKEVDSLCAAKKKELLSAS